MHWFHTAARPQLIVWSVGQGQMVTYSDLESCVHFDMGGEYFPEHKLAEECGQKTNQVFYSHWDWDHINFTRKAFKKLSSLCRLNWPGGAGSSKKKMFLSLVPACPQPRKDVFREITFPAHLNKNKRGTLANKYSRVVVVKQQVLIPGDSPGSSEPLWQDQVGPNIRVLVLSHHGSRYSTYASLLRRLPDLKIAAASARKKRYGHPHVLVKKRLVKRNIAVLSTEDFNHIYIPLQ